MSTCLPFARDPGYVRVRYHAQLGTRRRRTNQPIGLRREATLEKISHEPGVAEGVGPLLILVDENALRRVKCTRIERVSIFLDHSREDARQLVGRIIGEVDEPRES